MATIKLSELCSSIKNCISHFYNKTYTIVAETMDVKIPLGVGHCYMELVEKDEEGKAIVAKMRASMWYNDAKRELPKFQQITGFPFKSGLKILVTATLSYHEVYGMGLNIQTIDATYTLGDIAKKRQELILRLKKEGIFTLNKSLSLPQPIAKVAVISSQTAAGWGDFQDHLLHNQYQFPFYCQLFPAIMQGDKASESIIQALERVRNSTFAFDVVVIIRGGGAESHLQELETYPLAKIVATFPLPILTGIGHHKDENILDLIAFASFKTPTAVADFLVGKRLELLSEIETLQERLALLIQERQSYRQQQLTHFALKLPAVLTQRMHREKQHIDAFQEWLQTSCITSLHRQQLSLGKYSSSLAPSIQMQLHSYQEQTNILQLQIANTCKNLISTFDKELQNTETILRLLSPQKTLQRGFSIIRCDGKAVRNLQSLPKGTTIELITAQEKARATLQEVREGTLDIFQDLVDS